MKPGFPGFPPEALKFFRQLKRNNNREWFLAHKETYEQQVKAPMTELILVLGIEVRHLAPEMVVDPKKAIYRIYRDIRFSADKIPYKTQIAALFAPRGTSKHAGAALYFHLSHEELLVAGGVYMPGSRELFAIRNHIAAHPHQLRKIIRHRRFKQLFGSLEGEQLSRVPKGFPPDHPAADLLRYKQFLVSVMRPAELALSPELFPFLLQNFRVMMPLVHFLNSPLQSAHSGLDLVLTASR